MKTLKFLLEKEFKQIRRDKLLPKIIFIVPVFQLVILPFAANFELKNINLGIIDNDKSGYSQQLTDKVLSSGYFRLTDISSHYTEGLKAIETNKSDLLLEIPSGFERDLGKNGTAQVLIAANAVNGTKGGLGSSYLGNIINSFNEEKGFGYRQQDGITHTNLYNPYLDYKIFMVPGIIVFLLTIMSGFLAALNIVSEKEKGTIEQINVSPIPKSIFLLSKLIPFWIISFILLTLGVIIAYIIYGMLPLGSFVTIYIFALIYVIAFTGFGLCISAISSTQQQAMFMAFFFIIIFSLTSGLFTPISSMPEWAQKMIRLNPLSYFIEVMRMVYMKGSYFMDVIPQLLVTTLFAVVFNVLAIWGYRKSS